MIKVGTAVRHKPSRSNPQYHIVIGVGIVVAITDTRVRVKWENCERPRNYKAEQLEELQSANAETLNPSSTNEKSTNV